MLSLALKSGEYITIGDEIVVQVFKTGENSFHLAVDAPREIPIARGKLHELSKGRPECIDRVRRKPPTRKAK